MRIRLNLVAGVAAAALALTACGAAGGTSGGTQQDHAASPSSPTGQAYASKAFVVPLTVTVDASLKSPPNPDSRNLLSWDAAHDSSAKVRFLVPVNLYRPSSQGLPGVPSGVHQPGRQVLGYGQDNRGRASGDADVRHLDQ